MIIALKTFFGLVLAMGPAALAEFDSSNCTGGNYSVVQSPDSTTLSILFDDFRVESTRASRVLQAHCDLQIPLHLPTGTSLGVYKVDYRGFAILPEKQFSTLSVAYGLGRNNRGRIFRRKINGVFDGDFLFTETLGGGQMKRVGCGEEAILNVSILLGLQPGSSIEDSMAGLDSVDSTQKGELIYHFNLKKCNR